MNISFAGACACGVTAGNLDDPSWFRPQMDFFVCDAQPWDQMDPAIPKYDLYPPKPDYAGKIRGKRSAFACADSFIAEIQ
jgi:hypothetical protein